MHLHPQSPSDSQKEAGAYGGGSLADAGGELKAGPGAWGRWLRGPWPIALLLFAVTLFLTSRNIDYPYFYEKDAHSKVAQVLDGTRNFFHPLLMLNGTDLVMRALDIPRTHHEAVVTGRWFMAFCTATAVAAFAMLGYRLQGRLGAVCVGVLVMTHNLVFELAHFFKEDPALLVGLALSFWAMQVFWERRSTASTFWMGAACGVAVSGKYVGIAAFLLGLVLLWLASREKKPVRWGVFIAAFFGVTALINYQVFLHLHQFGGGFSTEMADVTRASKRSEVPHLGQAWEVLSDLVHWWIYALAAVQIAATLVRRPRRPVEWFLFLYPAIFLVVLLFSPRLFTRHFLPVIAFTCVLAGLGIPALVNWALPRLAARLAVLRRWPRERVAAVAVLAVLALTFRNAQRPAFWSRYKAFANPTREELIAFINTHLPKSAVIAADQNAYLVRPDGSPRLDFPVHCKVIVKRRMADFGSLQALYDLGVTHVALHGRTSPRLFAKASAQPPAKGQDDDDEDDPEEIAAQVSPDRTSRNYRENWDFYTDLSKVIVLEKAVPARRIAYVAPAVKLYRLEKTPGKSAVRAVPTP